MILSAMVFSASSHEIATNFGSSLRPFFGLVRFMGVLIRSGSYTCCRARWALGQLADPFTFDRLLPWTFIARPLTTYTSLEHQEVQPWQVEAIHWPMSAPAALPVWASARRSGVRAVFSARAAPVAAVAFTKLRRLSFRSFNRSEMVLCDVFISFSISPPS